MSVHDAIRTGDLDAALAMAKEAVRDQPTELKHRVLLFQLFAIVGDWDRASAQLDVAAELDEISLPMVQSYGRAISCERFRAEVFAGRRTPLVLGEPPEWIGPLIQALAEDARGQHAAAADLRAAAFDGAPTTAGTVNGDAFQWLADADPRLGPVLEVIMDGKYYWAPVDRVAGLDIEDPEDLRDLVWTPAHVTWSTGGEVVALMPTRYPGTESRTDDPMLRLSRKTIWEEAPGDLVIGVGQRLLATDAGDHALMDVRTLRCGDAATAATASDDENAND